MNKKTFEKRLNKRFNTMQKYIYEEIFVKSDNLDLVLKECLKKCIKYTTFANLRFTLVFNCLIKAQKENLYNKNFEDVIKKFNKICYYLDLVIDEISEILDIKKK